MSINKKTVISVIGLTVISTLIISSVLFFAPNQNSEAAHNDHYDSEWMVSTENTKYLAPNDIYRTRDGVLEVLIVEDDHNTMVSYQVEN